MTFCAPIAAYAVNNMNMVCGLDMYVLKHTLTWKCFYTLCKVQIASNAEKKNNNTEHGL